MELELRQKDVANQLNVSQDTIRNWEVGRSAPALWQWPGIVRFLGYAPFGTDGGLSGQLRAYRRLHGLSQRRLAAILGVDPTTVWHWEQGHSQPNGQHRQEINALIDR